MDLNQYLQAEYKRAAHILFDPKVKEKRQLQLDQQGFYTIPFDGISKGLDRDIVILLHGKTCKRMHKPKQILWHNHDYFEMVYVYRGGCFNQFQDAVIQLHQGDILLLNPNIMLSKSLFEGSMWQLLSDNKLMSNFFVNYFYQMNKTKDYMYFDSFQNHQIQDTITSMIGEYLSKKPGYHKVVQSYLVILFAYLSRQYIETNHIDQNNLGQNSLLPDIIAYIAQNYKSVTLTEVQDHFNYSSGHISRLMKQHTGKTFSEIVHNFKLDHAKELLQTTNLDMTEIAEQIGFNDSNYLNKVFKKRFGVAPSQYRKGMQNES